MGKLIGKTIAITVAAFVALLAIIFGILALACPNVIANMFSSLGSYSASVHFMERQYDKTGDYDDLVVLVKALDERDDAKRTVKYCIVMMDDKSAEFDAYVKADGKTDFGSEETAREFFYAKYAIAESYVGNIDKAITVATACVAKCGYTETNPFRSIIYDAGQGMSVADLIKVKDVVSILTASAENEKWLSADKLELDKLINAKN